MASDARINIDILLNNMSEFKSDVKLINDMLAKLGDNAGETMDDSFAGSADNMTDKARQTEQEVDDALAKDVTTNLNADSDDLEESTASAKVSVDEIPDEKETSLEADAEDAEQSTADVKTGYEELPDSETTELTADAEDAKSDIGDVKGEYASLPDSETTDLEANAEDAKADIGSVKGDYESLPETETTNLEANAEDAKSDIGSVKSGYDLLPDEKTTNLQANAEDAKADIGDVKGGYASLPDEETTNIQANAEDAKEDIGSVKGGYNSIPDSTKTNIEANAEDAKEDIGSVKGGYDSIPESKSTLITANTENAERNLGKLSNTAQETGGWLTNLKDKLTMGAVIGAASAGFQQLVGGLGDVIGETMNASDAILGFESTMDFAGFGKEKIEETEKAMKSYADNTVYDLETVSNTTAQLGANGVKDFEKLMEASGNLNAVAGGTSDSFDSLSMMMTQTAGAGKLTTENWNQLADAIPGASKKMQDAMKENGAYTGNFREAMEQGKISADEFFEAIMQLGDTDKAAEYAEGTSAYEGAIGNLKSAMQNGLLEMEEAIGKENITDIINNMADVAERSFKRMGEAVSFLVEHKEGVKVFADGVLALLAAFSTYKVITGFTKAIEALTIAMSLNPMALFIAAIVGVIVAFTALYKNSEGFRNFVDGIIEGAKEVYDNVVGWFKKLPGRISETWSNLSEGVSEGWNSFVETLSEWASKAWSAVKKPFVSVGHWFAKIWHTISKGASDGWETITETLSEWVGSAWRAIKKPFVAVGNWFSKIWNSISKGAKKGWNGIKKAVSIGAKAVKAVALAPIVVIAAIIVSVWDKIKKPTKKFWNWMKKTISGLAKSIRNNVTKWFNSLKSAISKIWNSIKKTTNKIWTPIKNFVINVAKSIKNNVQKWFNNLKSTISRIWNSIKKVTHKVWTPVKNFIINIAKTIKSNVQKWFNNLKNTISSIWNAIKKVTSSVWNSVKNFVINMAKRIWNGVKKAFNSLKNTVQNIWNGIKSITKSVWNATGGWLINKAKDIWQGVKKHFNSLKNSLSDVMDNISDKWHDTWNGIKNFFGDIWKTIKGKAKDGINGVIDWLNKGIGGINSVIHTFGGKKEAIGEIKTLATGGRHRGLAQVNDGNGEEAIIKNGRPYKVTGKNAIVNLEGDETVIPHEASRTMFGGSIQRYAKGTKGWFGKLTGWVKDKWDGITEFIKHPIESLKTIMTNKMGDITGSDFIKKFTPSMTTGFIKAIKDKFKSILKGLKDDHEMGGSFDGKMGPHGVYDYLWKVAKAVMKKFPGMRYTSGYRKGDPNFHGKHMAVDVGYPASMNGSSKYLKPAEWVFDNFKDRVAYVITQGKIKDRKGWGGKGKGKGWLNWGSHDHDDHLHINGAWGPGYGGGSHTKGHGTGSWRNQIKQAARQMKVNVSSADVSRILSLIKHESGGNQKIRQQIRDVNSYNGSGGAKGLLQYIQSTFDYYKVKGHGNIFSGYDQLLAFFNNKKWRTQFNPLGGWSPSGGRRFANGGEVHGKTLAWLGEDPSANHEYVINPKKDTADALISKAMASRAEYRPASSASMQRIIASGSQNNEQNSAVTKQDLNDLVSKINERPFKVDSYLDGRQVGNSVDENNAGTLKRKMFMRGVLG